MQKKYEITIREKPEGESDESDTTTPLERYLRELKRDTFVNVTDALKPSQGSYYARYAFEQRDQNGLAEIIKIGAGGRGVHLADPVELAAWVFAHPKMLKRRLVPSK